MRLLILTLFVHAIVSAQPAPTPLTGAAELKQTLDKLNTLGSVLMLGAHPDDENTAVIAYFARGRHMRTAYLSATRGEGGQNLIGTEQGPLMGAIRTQELLGARRIDGGEQFFTRVIDFGFSKNPEEAYKIWNRRVLLADMVRVIRKFRPDVVLNRFPSDGSGGHGQHTAVGHLAIEALETAADGAKMPELGEAWKAKRLYWNYFGFMRRGRSEPEGLLSVDVGHFNPVLGKSYQEIAGESRSVHRSQAMGAGQNPGSSEAKFQWEWGEEAQRDLFDGIDTSWRRVPGSERVAELLAAARDEFRIDNSEAILPVLLDAHKELAELDGYWPELKRAELLRAIELAAGLSIEARAADWRFVPGQPIPVELRAISRTRLPFTWVSSSYAVWPNAVAKTAPVTGELAGTPPTLAYNKLQTWKAELPLGERAPLSQPIWLAKKGRYGEYYEMEFRGMTGTPESPPVAAVMTTLRAANGTELTFTSPVTYRWVDRGIGERERDVEIVPPVAVSLDRSNMIFPTAEPRTVTVTLTAHAANQAGRVVLNAPPKWKIAPVSQDFSLERKDQTASFEFQITPPVDAAVSTLRAVANIGGASWHQGVQEIEYPHIPIQVVFPNADLRVARADIRLTSNDIGYVMGAGDLVPQALREIGASVTLLDENDLKAGNLGDFDAIVLGVRALNTRPDLLAARDRLLKYVGDGGRLVMQYNTTSRGSPFGRGRVDPEFAPYPMTTSRNRVTDETAEVTFPEPDHPLLQMPNHISEKDFEGWVQERGLYFMSDWDERYDAVLASADAGEEPQLGGLLYARYGDGVFIFTGYSWFRELPAGVPGAYRLFANLVSKQ